ncbi:MAG: hypothetical protein LUH63_07185 [Parabacteroides sp.]|nr:hypothetical protein [Parabacteroides sp.]
MAAGDIITSKGYIFTPADAELFVSALVEKIQSTAKDPEQYDLVEVLDETISSLPVFKRTGNTIKLVRILMTAFKGDKGDAFTYEDFTPEQLQALALTFEKLTPAQIDLLKIKLADLTPEDIAELQKPATEAAKRADDKLAQISEEVSIELTNIRQLEATVSGNEETRENSYTQWQAAEQGRQNDELKRKEAEALREAAEELRDTAESTRNTKETDRQAAEAIRQNTEKSRVEEETKRAAAEGIRNQAEQLRATEEGKRIEEEKKRVAAEILRNQSEINRDKAEKLRDDAETLRVVAEVDRDNAEQERIAEEGKRDVAEKARAAAEAERQKKEGERIVEEQLRKTAEVTRQENETTRQTQEEQREQETMQAILNAEKATGDANTAADRANAAAAGAEGLVKGFQSDWNMADPADPNFIRNKPEIPTLSAAPGADTLSYVNAAGTTINFRIGDEVRVLEDGEYVFYKLYDLADGVASWQEAGSGTALPGNIYLQGANYYNDSVIIIKEGYIQ